MQTLLTFKSFEENIKLFEMSNLGLFNRYMGIELDQGKSHISINQCTFALRILELFNMVN